MNKNEYESLAGKFPQYREQIAEGIRLQIPVEELREITANQWIKDGFDDGSLSSMPDIANVVENGFPAWPMVEKFYMKNNGLETSNESIIANEKKRLYTPTIKDAEYGYAMGEAQKVAKEKRLANPDPSLLGDFGEALKGGTYQLKKMGADTAMVASDLFASKESVQYFRDVAKAAEAEMAKYPTKYATIEDAWNSPNIGSMVRYGMTEGLFKNAPQLSATMAAYAVNPVVGLAVTFGMAAGDVGSSQMDEAGEMRTIEAAPLTAMYATLDSIMPASFMKSLTKEARNKLASGVVSELAKNKSFKDTLATALKYSAAGAEGFVKEAIPEGLQSYITEAAVKVVNSDKEIFTKETGNKALTEGFLGGFSGTVTGVAGKALEGSAPSKKGGELTGKYQVGQVTPVGTIESIKDGLITIKRADGTIVANDESRLGEAIKAVEKGKLQGTQKPTNKDAEATDADYQAYLDSLKNEGETVVGSTQPEQSSEQTVAPEDMGPDDADYQNYIESLKGEGEVAAQQDQEPSADEIINELKKQDEAAAPESISDQNIFDGLKIRYANPKTLLDNATRDELEAVDRALDNSKSEKNAETKEFSEQVKSKLGLRAPKQNQSSFQLSQRRKGDEIKLKIVYEEKTAQRVIESKKFSEAKKQRLLNPINERIENLKIKLSSLEVAAPVNETPAGETAKVESSGTPTSPVADNEPTTSGSRKIEAELSKINQPAEQIDTTQPEYEETSEDAQQAEEQAKELELLEKQKAKIEKHLETKPSDVGQRALADLQVKINEISQTPVGETAKVESNAPSISTVESNKTPITEQMETSESATDENREKAYYKKQAELLQAIKETKGEGSAAKRIALEAEIRKLKDDYFAGLENSSESTTSGSRKDDAPKGAPSAITETHTASESEYHTELANSSTLGMSSKAARVFREQYVRIINGLYEKLNKKLNDGQKEYLESELKKFKKEYLQKDKEVLGIAQGVVSVAIAGGSNFNSKQAKSRGNSYDKAQEKFSEWINDRASEITNGVSGLESQDSIDKKQANKMSLKFAGDIAYMTQPGMNKSSFLPSLFKLWEDLKAFPDVAEKTIKIIDKNYAKEGSSVEKIIGSKTKLWGDIKSFMDNRSTKATTETPNETTKNELSKPIIKWYLNHDPSGNNWRFSKGPFNTKVEAESQIPSLPSGHEWQLVKQSDSSRADSMTTNLTKNEVIDDSIKSKDREKKARQDEYAKKQDAARSQTSSEEKEKQIASNKKLSTSERIAALKAASEADPANQEYYAKKREIDEENARLDKEEADQINAYVKALEAISKVWKSLKMEQRIAIQKEVNPAYINSTLDAGSLKDGIIQTFIDGKYYKLNDYGKKLLSSIAKIGNVPDAIPPVIRQKGVTIEDMAKMMNQDSGSQDEEVKDSTPKVTYTYGFKARPMDIGTAPKGGYISGSYKADDKRARHGVAQYDRPLTAKELKDFELVDLNKKEEFSNGVEDVLSGTGAFAIKNLSPEDFFISQNENTAGGFDENKVRSFKQEAQPMDMFEIMAEETKPKMKTLPITEGAVADNFERYDKNELNVVIKNLLAEKHKKNPKATLPVFNSNNDRVAWIRQELQMQGKTLINFNGMETLGELREKARLEGIILPETKDIEALSKSASPAEKTNALNQIILQERAKIAKFFKEGELADVMNGVKTFKNLPDDNAIKSERSAIANPPQKEKADQGKPLSFWYLNSNGGITKLSEPVAELGKYKPVSWESLRHHKQNINPNDQAQVNAANEYIKSLSNKRNINIYRDSDRIEMESDMYNGKYEKDFTEEGGPEEDVTPFSKEFSEEPTQQTTEFSAAQIQGMLDAMESLGKRKMNLVFYHKKGQMVNGKMVYENGFLVREKGEIHINLTYVQARGMKKLLVHEDFVHLALRAILGDKQYKDLFAKVKAEMNKEGTEFNKLKAKIEKRETLKEEAMIDEVLAHWYEKNFDKPSETMKDLVTQVTRFFRINFRDERTDMAEIKGILDKAFKQYLKMEETPIGKGEGTLFSISSKYKAKVIGDLKNKEVVDPEKIAEQLEAFPNDKFAEIALHWRMKGTVILGEDDSRIIDAIKIANKKGLDPKSFDRPSEIIDRFANEGLVKLAPANPAEAKTFTNKRTITEHNIDIYDVEDSKEAQKDVRRMVNTHFGPKANPWCTVAIDMATGEFTEDSWTHWKNYPNKKIAFQNGKLVGFFGGGKWWDKNDTPSIGVPVVTYNKEKKKYEFRDVNEKSGVLSSVKMVTSDWAPPKTGAYTVWEADGETLKERFTNEGGDLRIHEKWHNNGQMASRINYKNGNKDGLHERWRNNGQMSLRINYKDGKQNGLSESWYDNGQMSERIKYKDGKQNGLSESWYDYGQMAERINYKDGNLDGLQESWYPDGENIIGTNPAPTDRGTPAPQQETIRYSKESEEDFKPVDTTSKKFKAWFFGSKIVDENGNPKPMYHGTSRPDRIGIVFRKDRATAGPMAYFTDDPTIASNYAKGKRDTSIETENLMDFMKVGEVSVFDYAKTMPALERVSFRKKLAEINYDPQAEKFGKTDNLKDPVMPLSKLQSLARGDISIALQNAFDLWVNSGTLFNRESEFAEILRMAGMKEARFDDPNAQYPGVYKVYLSVKNPLESNKITRKIIATLLKASKTAPKSDAYGADQWAKSAKDAKEWMDEIKADYESGTSYAWTTIPDWATKSLKDMGYDGVVDKGGKYGGSEHNVVIPFEESQVKSAMSNTGEYGDNDSRVLYSKESEEDFKPVDTTSKKFKAWFGNSKVVDENGEPLVVYHGTDFEDFFSFDKKKMKEGRYGKWFYFTDSEEKAKAYGKNIIKVYLKIEKTDPRNGDGRIIGSDIGNRIFLVSDPTQIKSATSNTGDFDPNNPDIRYSKESEEDYLELAKDPKANKEELQKMVDRAAKSKGYSIDQYGFRDGHSAPRMDDRTTKEKLEDGGDFSLAEVIKGYHNQPKDYFDPKVGPMYYGYRNRSGMESSAAINNIMKSPDKEIRVYRAVPNSIKLNRLVASDWVTPSKSYAVGHGEARFGEGEYRVISQLVSPTNLWWDGNDIREWGFDDGKSYASKDDKAKLLDPVTYDDNGEVIPLSERFKDESDDIRYSKESEEDFKPVNTTSKKFKAWFGDSKVVDDNGEPLRVYHGTTKEFSKFDMSKLGASTGHKSAVLGTFFTADPYVASEFAGENPDDTTWPVTFIHPTGANVMPANLSIKNPLVISARDFLRRFVRDSEDATTMRDSAISAGHDGILITSDYALGDSMGGSEYGADTWVSFQPTQIKSATSNTGDFDPNNPDIRYSKESEEDYSGDPKNPLRVTDPGLFSVQSRADDAFVNELTKKGVKVNIGDSNKILIKAVREAGYDGFVYENEDGSGDTYISFGPVAIESEVEKSLNSKIGARATRDQALRERGAGIGERIAELAKSTFKGFTQGFLDRKAPLRELDSSDWVYRLNRLANGASTAINMFITHGKISWNGDSPIVKTKKKGIQQLFKALGEKNTDNYLRYRMGKRAEAFMQSGRNPSFTPDEIEHLISLGDNIPNLAEITTKFDEINESVLDFAVQSGLLSAKAKIRFKKDFYIPFYRVMDDSADEGFYNIGAKSGGKNIDNYIEKYLGGDSKIGDPLENIIKNWTTLIKQSIENKARDAAIQRMMEVNLAVELVNKTDADQVLEEGREYFEFTTMTDKKKDRIISHMVSGERRHYRILSDEMLVALTVSRPQLLDNWVMKALMIPKRTLTYSATFGAAFKVANTFRDALTVSLTHKNFNPVMDTLKGMIKTFRQDEDFIRMMSAMGGFESGYVGTDAAMTAKNIRKSIQKRTTLSTAGDLLRFWEHVGSSMENATRMGLFMKMEKELGTTQAAFAARDILDFHSSGAADSVRVLTALTPFLNARLQGLYKLGRSAQENPRHMAIGLSIVAAASLILWSLRDDEKWKELEDWEKWTYHHFWIGGQHFRLPKPFELSVVSNVVEMTAEMLNGDTEMKKIFPFMLATLRDNFQIFDYPAAMKPFVEQWANKQFFTGREIVPEYMEKLEAGVQAQPWTGDTVKLIGETTGLSPLRIEHLARAFGATISEAILSASDWTIHAADNVAGNPLGTKDKPAMDANEMPLFGRFIRSDVPRNTKYGTDYYKIRDEISKAYATVQHFKKTGDIEAAKDLINDSKWQLKMKTYADVTDKRLSLLRKKSREIWESKELDRDEKKRQLDDISKRQTEIQKIFYDKYKELREKS